MNDINRLVIFLLLIALIYALYKYQYLILEKLPEQFKIVEKQKQIQTQIQTQKQTQKQIQKQKQIQNKNIKKNKYKQVTIDNISQVSIGSLENENENNRFYKQDSILGSLASESGNYMNNSENSENSGHSDINSLFEINSNDTNKTTNTQQTKDSFFF